MSLDLSWPFVQERVTKQSAINAIGQDVVSLLRATPRLAMEHRMQIVFADCVLDLDRRELTRGSETIAVGPKVFDLLVYLVKNRDRVVSKDDLLDTVWAGRIVSESTLTSHINAVRKAIGDTGEDQRLLRTIARKGFRFVGDVKDTQSPAA